MPPFWGKKVVHARQQRPDSCTMTLAGCQSLGFIGHPERMDAPAPVFSDAIKVGKKRRIVTNGLTAARVRDLQTDMGMIPAIGGGDQPAPRALSRDYMLREDGQYAGSATG